jgi:hypothetical protein
MVSRNLEKFFAKLKGGGRVGAKDTDHNQRSTLASAAAADRGDEDAELSARASAQINRSGQSSTRGRVDGTTPSLAGASELGNAAETVQISGGEQSESAETNEESPIPTIPPTFTHNTLWDKAYNNLKGNKEKAKFVEVYEKILSRVFLKKTTLETTSSNDQNKENAIAQDPPSREKQMKQIVEKGLEKIEKAKNATEVYGKFFDLVTPFKAVLDAGLKNVPQAALPWAVVSSSLDVSYLKTSISVKSSY